MGRQVMADLRHHTLTAYLLQQKPTAYLLQNYGARYVPASKTCWVKGAFSLRSKAF